MSRNPGPSSQSRQNVSVLTTVGSDDHSYAHELMGLPVVAVEADATGETDSTAAVLAAIARISDVGCIEFPKGIFKVSGLPLRTGLYYIGQGRGCTQIIAGYDHAFKAEAGALESGGVIGFEATGDASADDGYDGTLDFVNLEAATSAVQFFVADCYATRWRSAYRGSQDDREPRIHNNSFWYNINGIYVENNHPLLTGVNDIRANQYGLTGDTIYDMNIIGQKFTYNQYGVVPQPGKMIENTQLIGCVIGFNTDIGAQLHKGCAMSGGQLLVGASVASARGVVLTGPASVIGVEIQSFGLPFTTAAVCIANTANVTGIRISGNKIAYNGTRIGTFVLHEPSNVSFGVYLSSITDNHMYLINGADRLINFTGPALYVRVSGNIVDCQATSTVPVISMAVSGTSSNHYVGNIINMAGGAAYAIDARVPASFANGNTARRGGGFNWTNADANTGGTAVGSIASTVNIYVP